jgi:class 3 adenylate cyclase
MALLPTGTVTFLFADIEGSTDLLQQLGSGFAEIVGSVRLPLVSTVAFQRPVSNDEGTTCRAGQLTIIKER